jgi:hypothetical protein
MASCGNENCYFVSDVFLSGFRSKSCSVHIFLNVFLRGADHDANFQEKIGKGTWPTVVLLMFILQEELREYGQPWVTFILCSASSR